MGVERRAAGQRRQVLQRVGPGCQVTAVHVMRQMAQGHEFILAGYPVQGPRQAQRHAGSVVGVLDAFLEEARTFD